MADPAIVDPGLLLQPAVDPDPLLIPTRPIPPAPDAGYDWRHVLEVAKEHRGKLLFAQFIALAAAASSVPIPLFMPLMVDEVLLEQPGALLGFMQMLLPASWQQAFGYILFALLLTVSLRLLSLALGVWQSRQFTILSKDLTFRIRTHLLQRLQRVSMSEYETVGGAAVSARLVTDLETVDQFFGATISRLLVAVLTLLGVAGVLLWMHWQIALLLLFANPIVIYFTTVLGKRVKTLKKHENAAFELFQQSVTETLEAIHQIRASNRDRHYLHRLIEGAGEVKRHGIRYAWKSDAANRLSFAVFLLGFDAFRAAAMIMVLVSSLSIGQMFAIFGYLWFMMGPVQELLHIQYAAHAAAGALQRINALLRLQQEPRWPAVQNPFADRRTVGIVIDRLHFAYGDGPEILSGVSLEIAAGEKVALVGASGGGKSTLVQVLIGLYPATAGRICYGGAPVTSIGMEVVRQHVATVLQHPVLFNDTVRNNLTLGQDLPDSRLWEALAIAQLQETVRAMEDGIDTVVGRQGIRLSGGQRQRLAVARMVLSEPRVVILDEATSALDAETEYRLHSALGDFLSGRTTLIVAHRLSAIKQAARVYVFEAGAIAEQGNHQELLLHDGLYARLYGAHQSLAGRARP